MAQITRAERIRRIKELLAQQNKIPPERHEVERLPSVRGDEPLLCDVINISVEEVLLNPRSHRIRAQLDDDPEWQELGKDPYSEAAQRIVARYVRETRKDEEFKALKESLVNEGQADAGVMTYEGILVNANTRAVALRELEDPTKRFIRVAVLPETIQPEETDLLELRLQMQKELKVEYTLTNELLFIEELSTKRRLTNSQIARELRIFPESEKKGTAEVELRLRMLDLIRTMQKIPAERLPLTAFDKISYEQLRDLERTYAPLARSDPDRATKHLESFLLSVLVGVTPVHQLRRVDSSFMTDYMLPQLEEDEAIGTFATKLAETPPAPKGKRSAPKGVDMLSGKRQDGPEETVDVKGLIDVMTQKDKTVRVPGSNVVLEREDVKDAVKAAIITGVKEKRRDATAEDKLEAPIEALKAATKQMTRCVDALSAVSSDPDFDAQRRKSAEAAFKRLKRTLRNLETALTKAKITATGTKE